MQSPAYRQGPVTTTLNDGVTGTAPATSDATGFTVYASLVNAPTILYRQSGILTFGTNVALSSITTALGTAPTSNTSTILPPAAAPILNNIGAGGSLTAGTYYIAYTYHTAGAGETIVSPSLAVTVPGPTSQITINAVYDPVQTHLQIELAVSRLENWHVTRYAILASPAKSVPTCNVYVDSVATINLIDTTALGAQNSANADLALRPGQRIICQWVGIDPSAAGAFSVYGEKATLP